MRSQSDIHGSSPTALECPRCGHQLGVMADDAERRGETRGTCSECGLDIAWSSLRADAIAPSWFVEARASRRNILRRAFGTLVRTARPFRFWSSIDLALPLSVRGLVVFVALLCVIAHLVCAVPRFLIDSPVGPMRPLPRAVESAPTIGKAALALLWPYDTIDGAEVVVSAYQSGLATTLFPLLGDSAWLAMEAIWKGGGHSPPPIGFAILDPYGEFGIRWLSRRVGLHECDTLFPSGFAEPAVLGMAVAGLTPLVMLLLPVSLRKARVRPRHFVRMLVLGFVLPLVVLLCALSVTQAMRAFGLLKPADADYHLYLLGAFRDPYYTFAVLLLATALGATWTSAAASRYLKLPNACAVGVACGTVSALTAAVALFLV
ncbi:MAG: hypothetical protein RLY21_1053 [Planctomycetota bacterium]|jgi:predicted RNA-binding Zn-ribbon protein involved in translation (DUF1610 family)